MPPRPVAFRHPVIEEEFLPLHIGGTKVGIDHESPTAKRPLPEPHLNHPDSSLKKGFLGAPMPGEPRSIEVE